MLRTRSALANKIEALEEKVTTKVRTVRAKVEEVRDKVKDVRDKVKRSFDLPYQVRQHPWPAFGASVLVGVVLGSITRDSDLTADEKQASASEELLGPSSLHGAGVPSRRSERPGMFADEFKYLRQTAVGAVMSLVRNGLKQTFPGLAPQAAHFVDGLTRKLGGEPIEDVFERPAD